MSIPTEFCNDDARRDVVRARPDLNGLDYLEVSDDQTNLKVFFLGKAPKQLLKRQGEDTAAYRKRLRKSVQVTGGQRIRKIDVIEVEIHIARDPKTGRPSPEIDDWMTVHVDQAGDFSTYTLWLVGIAKIDSFYDHIDFTFKAGCPSDLDCQPANLCPAKIFPEPDISYLAKDYSSFRQLILDRLSLIMPDWQERHIPDAGITLVEILAYAGDYLSYYQDAVASEAYLNTARQRISVRRHARLVDYLMHEGCSARAWLCINTDSDLTGADAIDPQEVFFITGANDVTLKSSMLTLQDLQNVPASRYEVFEPVEQKTIELFAAHNRMCFYTWGNRECCLPAGATAATLKNARCKPLQAEESPAGVQTTDSQQTDKSSEHPSQEPQSYLHLKAGDVLIFEEVTGPKTGSPFDADPLHRHAVRLTKVTYTQDSLYQPPVPVVETEWAEEDALPFPLCISAVSDAQNGCLYLEDISVACGNVILVDHGRSEFNEELGWVPCQESIQECECENHLADITFLPGRYRPSISKSPLAYRVPFPQPGIIASQQARTLAGLMVTVHRRVEALERKTDNDQTLDSSELEEIQAIYGVDAMEEMGPLSAIGKEWSQMNSAEQTYAIHELLVHEDRLIADKTHRIAVLLARAQAGIVLSGAAAEVAAMFGAPYGVNLNPTSAYALGSARSAMLQDPRVARPEIQLFSAPAAPAASCDQLQPLFTGLDWRSPEKLVPALRDPNNPSAQVLRARFSRKTLQMIDRPGQGAASGKLKEALSKELAQLLQTWSVQTDLLESQSDDFHYMVENNNDGQAILRFGDGQSGRLPAAGSAFIATYRVGGGVKGNVGADSITYIVFRTQVLNGVKLTARNPQPGSGGVDPEPVEEVKLFTPGDFRKRIERAITPGDYAQLADREFGGKVQRSAASLDWSGSWYEVQVGLDPLGSEEASPGLLTAVRQGLEQYRRLGHDLSVMPARYVPLDIEINVCVLPHYLRGHVEAALGDIFSSRTLPGGKQGVFHPDVLNFDGGIYVSRLVAAAQAVSGVESVEVTKLQRLNEGDRGELYQGVLHIGPMEIARLDNDPSFPEHGRLVLNIGGGR